MPKLPPRPCTAPRCAELATIGGRCDTHAITHGWHHIKTSTQRGYGYAWTKLRRSVLMRDSFLCQTCMRAGRYIQGREVDHIRPKSQGGGDNMDNLECICVSCHKTKTHKEAANARRT